MLKETLSQSSSNRAISDDTPFPTILDTAISRAKTELINLQNKDGFWVFELEADCTIPAEYILMMHFMDEINYGLQAKIANFLRTQQSDNGSYLLYKGGGSDLSGTVKAYYALKLAGDSVDSAHMVQSP